MRPLLASVPILLALTAAAASQGARSGVPTTLTTRQVIVTAERVDRFSQWIEAVHDHEPGERDAAVERVLPWSGDELREVWADSQFLVALMRNLRVNHLEIPQRRERVAIVYKQQLLQRMRAMACAAAGRLVSNDCIAIHAEKNLDERLRTFAADAAADRDRTGEDNYLLRRAAIFHGDVEMLVKPVLDVADSTSERPLPGPRRLRADTNDGVSMNAHEVGVHWEIARTLLSLIVPKHADRPAPARDSMVRAWYRATLAWMQQVESYDTDHLDRARDIFPDDPDILFLSGTLRETYASPEIQAAVHSLPSIPGGFEMDIGSAHSELRQAEGFFRRALAHAPEMAEAHLRLGRVLALQGHDAEAIPELQQALTRLGDEQLEYDGELFIGAAYEGLGRYDEAAAAYEHAASRFPTAQSPLIALSQLARRRGDRTGALAAIARMFALPSPADDDRRDPWWTYKTAQARNADRLLEAVWAPFRRSAQ